MPPMSLSVLWDSLRGMMQVKKDAGTALKTNVTYGGDRMFFVICLIFVALLVMCSAQENAQKNPGLLYLLLALPLVILLIPFKLVSILDGKSRHR